MQSKLKDLDALESILMTKNGDKEVEEKLGVRIDLMSKYHTIQHFDDPLPGIESPNKKLTKSYAEKKLEQKEQDSKIQDDIDLMLGKLKEDKRKAKEKKRMLKLQRNIHDKKIEEELEKKKLDDHTKEIEERKNSLIESKSKI